MHRLLTILLAVLLAVVFSYGTPLVAEVVWSGNGHHYELVTTPRSFADAQTDATNRGCYLVTITSAAENAFVAGLVGPDS